MQETASAGSVGIDMSSQDDGSVIIRERFLVLGLAVWSAGRGAVGGTKAK